MRLHDDAVWATFGIILQTEARAEDAIAHEVVSLPARTGGLGFRSATRSAPSMYWASWVVVLPVMARPNHRIWPHGSWRTLCDPTVIASSACKKQPWCGRSSPTMQRPSRRCSHMPQQARGRQKMTMKELPRIAHMVGKTSLAPCQIPPERAVVPICDANRRALPGPMYGGSPGGKSTVCRDDVLN